MDQEKIIASINKKILAFRKKHFTYMFCYPFGKKGRNKDGVDKSPVVRKYIYLCRSCENKCKEFNRKIYLCYDLRCKNWPICMYLSEKKMIEECKRVGYYSERKRLDKSYVRFMILHQFLYGFKTNPEKTYPFFKEFLKSLKKDNPGRKKHGKVQSKEYIKKDKKLRKKQGKKSKTHSKK